MSFLKKTKKKNAKSSVGLSSKLKKHSKPKLAFLCMAALLLLTTVGYAGFSYLKLNAYKKADAAGWTYLNVAYPPNNTQVKWMRACKVYMPGTGYGNLWKVTFHVYRNTPNIKSIIMVDYRNEKNSGSVSQYSWLYGVVAGLDIIVSKDLGDRVYFEAQYADNYGNKWPYQGELNGVYHINPANLRTC